jgi:hypothetical protein
MPPRRQWGPSPILGGLPGSSILDRLALHDLANSGFVDPTDRARRQKIYHSPGFRHLVANQTCATMSVRGSEEFGAIADSASAMTACTRSPQSRSWTTPPRICGSSAAHAKYASRIASLEMASFIGPDHLSTPALMTRQRSAIASTSSRFCSTIRRVSPRRRISRSASTR